MSPAQLFIMTVSARRLASSLVPRSVTSVRSRLVKGLSSTWQWTSTEVSSDYICQEAQARVCQGVFFISITTVHFQGVCGLTWMSSTGRMYPRVAGSFMTCSRVRVIASVSSCQAHSHRHYALSSIRHRPARCAESQADLKRWVHDGIHKRLEAVAACHL